MACNSDRKGRVFQGGFNSGTYTNYPLAVSKIAKGDKFFDWMNSSIRSKPKPGSMIIQSLFLLYTMYVFSSRRLVTILWYCTITLFEKRMDLKN